MELKSASPRHTFVLAHRLGELAQPGTVLVLEGPLGAGKTSFVKGLAHGLGITGVVNSPTFTIVKEYRGRLPLFHFDLYRLEEAEELWELGLDEYLTSGGVCALEWGERALDLLPEDRMHIRLEPWGDEQRIIYIKAEGAVHAKLAEELMSNVDPGN